MKTAALADALTIGFQSLTEALPDEHRRYVRAILSGVLRDPDMVLDVDARQLIWRLAGLPARRPAPPAKPARPRRSSRRIDKPAA
jgi:hypothetical protein